MNSGQVDAPLLWNGQPLKLTATRAPRGEGRASTRPVLAQAHSYEEEDLDE